MTTLPASDEQLPWARHPARFSGAGKDPFGAEVGVFYADRARSAGSERLSFAQLLPIVGDATDDVRPMNPAGAVGNVQRAAAADERSARVTGNDGSTDRADEESSRAKSVRAFDDADDRDSEAGREDSNQTNPSGLANAATVDLASASAAELQKRGPVKRRVEDAIREASSPGGSSERDDGSSDHSARSRAVDSAASYARSARASDTGRDESAMSTGDSRERRAAHVEGASAGAGDPRAGRGSQTTSRDGADPASGSGAAAESGDRASRASPLGMLGALERAGGSALNRRSAGDLSVSSPGSNAGGARSERVQGSTGATLVPGNAKATGGRDVRPDARAGDRAELSGRGGAAMSAESERSADAAAIRAHAVRGLTAALRVGGGTVSMRLTPEALGDLRVRMTIRHGVVEASMTVASAQAKRLLDESVPRLRESLERQGFTVDRLLVELSSDAVPPGASLDPPVRRAGVWTSEGSRAEPWEGGGLASRSRENETRSDPFDATSGGDAGDRGGNGWGAAGGSSGEVSDGNVPVRGERGPGEQTGRETDLGAGRSELSLTIGAGTRGDGGCLERGAEASGSLMNGGDPGAGWRPVLDLTA